MSDDTDRWVPEARLTGDLPVTDAASAAEHVPGDATMLVSGFGSVGYPKAVPLALADSARDGDRDLSLTVVSGGSVGSEIDTTLVEAGAVARRYPYVGTPEARAAANEDRMATSDRHVSAVADEARFGHYGRPDVAVVEAVACGPDWLVPSGSLGQTPAFVEAADTLVVEVNAHLPRELALVHDVWTPADPPNRGPIPLTDPGKRIGSPRIAFDPAKLRAVVRTDRPDDAYEFRDPTPEVEAVAANLREFLAGAVDRPPCPGRLRMQFGVGSLGNAMMAELAEMDAPVEYVGEVIQDGLLDMVDDGDLSVVSGTALALSHEGQDRLFADLERYAEAVVLRPAEVSNAPGVVSRMGVIAVNAAAEVDLYGHVNSTHVEGSRLLNGLGGSGDFWRNAGLSVVAVPSTAGGGDISRVVPMATHVDHTEHDVDVLVTDHGVADLRGTSPRERSERIVACAAPEFRGELRAYLDRANADGGHEPHDLQRAFDWRG
jgi:succinyl-CoA:acetate CoA-transferase